VPHIVALSTLGVDHEKIAGPAGGLREFERLLLELGRGNVLVLRSAFYMDNLLGSLPLIESQKINGSAIAGDIAFPMIATTDVAREAAERLSRRDFTGHGVKLLLGPGDVSMREATRALGSLLRMPELPYVEFPPAEMKAALVGAGMSDEAASLIVDMQLAVNEGGIFDGIERTAETTTPTRLDEFLRGALAVAAAT
jgi:uncharacterized protein YbjT (DUF2867 family)